MNVLRTTSLFILLACLGLGLASCGSNDSSTSSLSITLPSRAPVSGKAGALATPTSSTLIFAVINVTGPGISHPIYVPWSAHKGEGTIEPAPATFTVEVPSGNSRLIQMLTVFGDPDDDSAPMEFYYGDVVAALQPGDQTLSLVLSQMAAGPITESRVGGRYLRTLSDGTVFGPSGVISSKLKIPRPDRPPMLIEVSHMFGGWFQMTLREGLDFIYIFEPTQEELFPNLSTTMLDSLASDSSGRVVKVNIPKHYRDWDGSGAERPTEVRSAGTEYFGFFGPGSTSRLACYSKHSISTIDGAYASGDPTWTPLSWIGVGSDASNFEAMAGGKSIEYDGCGSAGTGTAGENYITYQPKQLSSGRDATFGFQGPYWRISVSGWSSQVTVKSTVSSTGLTVEWSYLPGVFDGPRGITGTHVFYRRDTTENYRLAEGDGADCKRLESLGFTKQVPAAAGAVHPTSTTITANTPFDENNLAVAICPYIQMTDGSIQYISAGSAETTNHITY